MNKFDLGFLGLILIYIIYSLWLSYWVIYNGIINLMSNTFKKMANGSKQLITTMIGTFILLNILNILLSSMIYILPKNIINQWEYVALFFEYFETSDLKSFIDKFYTINSIFNYIPGFGFITGYIGNYMNLFNIHGKNITETIKNMKIN